MKNLTAKNLARVSAVAALVALSACGGNEISAPVDLKPVSQFTANVTGALQMPLAGKAALLTVPPATVGTITFPASAVLGLSDKGGAIVAFQWYGVAAPTPGSYEVGFGSNDIAMSYDQSTGAVGAIFDGTGGTVTITSTKDGYVSGTFSVAAAANDTNAQIAVTGVFTAEIVTEPATP